MTNTDIREQARRVIKEVTAQLDQGLIKSLFDEPIHSAARQFKHGAGCPVSHKTFHKVLADFVLQIYDRGLNAHWKLSAGPLGEAIALLEYCYQSNYGRGYIAAALDANDAAEGGIDRVLRTLAEIIKDTERQKYLRSVFATNIEAADWHLQCEIVRVLLEGYGPFLPDQLRLCTPWELVSHIPSIMFAYLSGDSALREILAYPQGVCHGPGAAHPDVSSMATAARANRQGQDW